MTAEERFREIVTQEPQLMAMLRIINELGLPNWYLGAGAVAQLYWNYIHGFPAFQNIKDIDIVYYEPNDLSKEYEEFVADQLKNALREFPFIFDATNEARVHLWYEQEFGKHIEQYLSSEDAIDSWPTTASAIGLTLDGHGNLVIYAPFGLDDLVSLTVRANKKLISEEVYSKKSERWKGHWPMLEIMKW